MGRGQIGQDGCSRSLAPCFINNHYIAAEIICSPAHVHHEVRVQSQAALCCRDIWAPPRKQRHCCCVTAVYVGSATRAKNIGVYGYGGCISQERTNMSAVPMLPKSASSLSARTLPALGQWTVNTVRCSNATGTSRRVKSDTVCHWVLSCSSSLWNGEL